MNMHVYDKNFSLNFLYLIPLVESVLSLSLCLLKAYLPNIIRHESNNFQNKYIYQGRPSIINSNHHLYIQFSDSTFLYLLVNHFLNN